jgi:FKBP-type peptidyl-prolyl cis-trans isomerase SlyD
MGASSRKGIQMSKEMVENGIVVSIQYSLHVDGELLDSSENHGPLQFLAGHGNIVAGLENEMQGMRIGESKDVVVSPADGYGEYDEEAFMEVPASQFPNDMKIEEGMELTVRDDSDVAKHASVESIEGETVRLNFNHPLAGEELHFNVKVVALREPTDEEL